MFNCLIVANIFIALLAQDSVLVIEAGAKLEPVVTGLGMPDGPAWDGKVLWFPDVKKQQLLRYDPATRKTEVVLDKAGVISATEMDHRNRLVLSEHVARRLARLDGDKTEVIFQHPESKPARNPNDLTIHNDGGIYHTLTSTDEVWYTSPDGSKSFAAVTGIRKPNGITLSPDEKTLYVSAFVEKKIYAYDVRGPGELGAGRVIASMDAAPDLGADGMTVDAEGNIYCAGPKDIWVWNAKGEPLTKIAVPQKPINCEFGDADRKSLYITAGDSIYRMRMNVRGADGS